MKHYAFAALVMAGAMTAIHPAIAASAQALSLDVRAGVALALKQSPALMASEMGVSSADADLAAAKATLFPRVDIRSSAVKTDSPLDVFGTKLLQQSVSAGDLGIATLNNPSPITNFQNSISASYPLFAGGAISGRIDEARDSLQASMHASAMRRQDVIYRVIESFAALEAARAMKAMTAQAIKSSQEHLRIANALLARGMIVKSDVLNAKVHLEDSQVADIAATNAEARSLDEIRALLNLGADHALHIKEGIAIHPTLLSLAQLTHAAMQRPDLLALKARRDAAEAGNAVARAGLLPHVNLVATEQWNDPHLQLQHPNYQIAAMVDLNVFAGGRDKAAMDKAEAERSRLSFEITDKSRQIENEVARAYRGLHEADQRLASRQQALAQARESLRITEVRFKVGLARMADLLQAQTQRDRARAELIRARFDQITTRARLYLVTGQLTPEVLQ